MRFASKEGKNKWCLARVCRKDAIRCQAQLECMSIAIHSQAQCPSDIGRALPVRLYIHRRLLLRCVRSAWHSIRREQSNVCRPIAQSTRVERAQAARSLSVERTGGARACLEVEKSCADGKSGAMTCTLYAV